jgi:hypothetical protein
VAHGEAECTGCLVDCPRRAREDFGWAIWLDAVLLFCDVGDTLEPASCLFVREFISTLRARVFRKVDNMFATVFRRSVELRV